MRLANTMVGVDNTRFLYVSAWAAKPTDTLNYDNCNFIEAVPMRIEGYPAPMPVRMDLATATYLRSRNIRYIWEVYDHVTYFSHDATLAKLPVAREEISRRARITHIEYDADSGDATRITLPWDDFLARYMADTQTYDVPDVPGPPGVVRVEAKMMDDDEERQPIKRRT